MPFPQLQKLFPAIKQDEPLKNHSTFRVGGPADFFYELHNIEELPALIEFAETNHLPYFIFGQGSNILFLDGGFRGLMIKNFSNRVEIRDTEITADSGLILALLIKKALANNLVGLEAFIGLPGTIGGAVYGNAGVPGSEISDFLEYITIYNIGNGVQRIYKKDLTFSYRDSSLKKQKNIIITVTLKLKKGDSEKSKVEMKKVDAARRGKQPIGFTCGSFFKNPSPQKAAGLLIDKAGLKGFKVGSAQISEKHGNFFLNLGNATAGNILELAQIAKQKVKEKFNIDLEEEVQIIGVM